MIFMRYALDHLTKNIIINKCSLKLTIWLPNKRFSGLGALYFMKRRGFQLFQLKIQINKKKNVSKLTTHEFPECKN